MAIKIETAAVWILSLLLAAELIKSLILMKVQALKTHAYVRQQTLIGYSKTSLWAKPNEMKRN